MIFNGFSLVRAAACTSKLPGEVSQCNQREVEDHPQEQLSSYDKSTGLSSLEHKPLLELRNSYKLVPPIKYSWLFLTPLTMIIFPIISHKPDLTKL